jgi:hydrogenase maturation protein HypF
VGIIMDGTGYGTDGTVWGGEILVYTGGEVIRSAHIEEVEIPRGDAAQRYPSIAALSWLIASGVWGDPFWSERLGGEAVISSAALKARINSISTTSAGRLCEGMGSLVLGIKENEYEAHAALALEAISKETISGGAGYKDIYSYGLEDGKIIFSPAIAALCRDIKENGGNRASLSEISARWHNTFAAAVSEAGIKAAREYGIKDIALSGGVFQNRVLLESVHNLVTESGFRCRLHKNIPANDGGISLGQAYSIYLQSI